MSEEEGTELDDALAASGVETADDSLLADLQAKQRAIGEQRTLDLDIPGYGGMLVGRYKYVPFEEISEIIKKASKHRSDKRIAVKAACDVLIKTCEEILIQIDGKLLTLGDAVREFDGDRITYSDPRLSKAVAGVELAKGSGARAQVRAVFGEREDKPCNDYALIGHQEDVVAWLEDPERDRDF